jgi:CheY-like chemotaxis protein
VVKHSGTLAAEVSLAAEGDEIRLEVADHGRGAPQGLETRPPRTDAGFGLFSIRERLQVLDGKMSIHSTAGEGMRIVLRLPLTTPSPTQASSMVYESAQRVMRPQAPAPGSAAGRTIRILLVDDHEIMRAGLASLLQDDPTIRIVGEAGNGAQALELARSTRPDLILMDVSMPTMDGVEATRQILHEIPTALIVGLSVHDEVGRAEAMRASGACGYLPKGCPADQLLAAIHKYADHAPCRD